MTDTARLTSTLLPPQKVAGDHDLTRLADQALQARAEYVGGSLASAAERVLPGKRTVGLFLAALLVATGAFWSVVLTRPPQTQAAAQAMDAFPADLLRGASRHLPVAQYDVH